MVFNRLSTFSFINYNNFWHTSLRNRRNDRSAVDLSTFNKQPLQDSSKKRYLPIKVYGILVRCIMNCLGNATVSDQAKLPFGISTVVGFNREFKPCT